MANALTSGSQVILCDVPIRYDTYAGCSHKCLYCFVQRKNGDAFTVEPRQGCLSNLKSFIEGKRERKLNWCDFKIPIHWGGMSDPFQPIEQKYGMSFESLKIFADSYYPFIVSTKGRLICSRKYLDILKKCNAVVQISMVCDKYDKLEKGAPTYQERLKMASILSKNSRRVIARVQPYMREILPDLLNNLPKLKNNGVYGITIEGMKFFRKQGEGKNILIKVGNDYCYPIELLRKDFEIIRKECNSLGLHFFCAENRLRNMGEDKCCCGIAGLDNFGETFKFNTNHLLSGEHIEATPAMKKIGSAWIFKDFYQQAGVYKVFANKTFEQMMLMEIQKQYGKKGA